MHHKTWLENRTTVTIKELALKLKIDPLKIAVFLSKIGNKKGFTENEFILTSHILRNYNLFKQVTEVMTIPVKSNREITIHPKKSLQKKAHMQLKHRNMVEWYVKFAEVKRA